MYRGILILLLLMLCLYVCGQVEELEHIATPTLDPKFILKYEYGKRVPNDHLAYHTSREIPPLSPYWEHFINLAELRPEFERNFTYLIVEYISPLSTVDINYDPKKTSINFYIRIPFLTIQFGVAGFALYKNKHRRNWCKH